MFKNIWFIAYCRENITLDEKLFLTEVWPSNYPAYIKVLVHSEMKPSRR